MAKAKKPKQRSTETKRPRDKGLNSHVKKIRKERWLLNGSSST